MFVAALSGTSWFTRRPTPRSPDGRRAVDGAVNMALHFILQHLDSSGYYTRILIWELSSAYNFIEVGLLEGGKDEGKMSQLSVTPPASTLIILNLSLVLDCLYVETVFTVGLSNNIHEQYLTIFQTVY